ncbi:MAG: exopolyphosphatase [Candidatus Zixiibacteriota bacterium]
MTPNSRFDKVAAVDLGSNSFHLLVARFVDGQIHVLDRLRQRILLGAGLDQEQNLTDEVQERALECLRLFGQHLEHMPSRLVRAVGTNALRLANNAPEFLARARQALGHPIEVISGPEEARLVYLGVAHSLAAVSGRRLVIDIGGGSTEMILGEKYEPIRADSLYIGCVSHSLRYFPNGRIRKSDFEKAEIQARLEFNTIERHYRDYGWDECIGSSGTVLTINQVLRENGWSKRGITMKGLRKLRKALIEAGSVDKLTLAGMPPERGPIFPGGVAILIAAFDRLGIERMVSSEGALREGLIFDLIGRFEHEDIRDHTIRRFAQRYQVDAEQAARIERTGITLLRQVANAWNLDLEESTRYLGWASRLLEIGLSLSFRGYQKHGAYIIENADMPGFSQEDQRFLAAVVMGHRRKISAAFFRQLPPEKSQLAMKLCLLLRLAVRLHRSRSPEPLPKFSLSVSDKSLQLAFPEGWLDHHPLTLADLEDERERLQAVGFELTFR